MRGGERWDDKRKVLGKKGKKLEANKGAGE